MDERMPRRADNLGALAPANPSRHHHRLGAHVLEAVALHRVGGPRDGAFEILGSAQPVAVRVGQLRQAAPGEVVGGGRVNQSGARVAIGIEPRHAGGHLRVGLRNEDSQSDERREGSRRERSAEVSIQ